MASVADLKLGELVAFIESEPVGEPLVALGDAR